LRADLGGVAGLLAAFLRAPIVFFVVAGFFAEVFFAGVLLT
jgi:hypothetical protein